MSSTGSGYDLSAGTFSPDGRIFQVEYAQKAVENNGTVLGIHCTDGVVLGVEKLLLSRMLVAGTNKRIHTVDRHMGMALGGLVSDGRRLVNRAREEASTFQGNYGETIPPHLLAERMAQFIHYFTLYGSVRPFGSAILLAGYDADKEQPWLNLVEPSGLSFRFRAVAIGKGQQAAKTELEKYKVFNMTCREALKYVAKILHLLHDEVKDKPFEMELSWVCEESKWMHEMVPSSLRDEVEEWAKKAIEDDEMDDDDDDE